MSTTVTGTPPPMADGKIGQPLENETAKDPAHWKGFVAGVFSGVAKLSVGHP